MQKVSETGDNPICIFFGAADAWDAHGCTSVTPARPPPGSDTIQRCSTRLDSTHADQLSAHQGGER